MRKYLLCILPLFAASLLLGQKKSGPPYSIYGLGEERVPGTMEYQAMQGVSIFADSLSVNIRNPAALSKLRITGFSAGMSYSKSFFSLANSSVEGQRTDVEYFTIGMPISKKMGIAFGIYPKTFISYGLGTSATSSKRVRDDYWDGKGGLYDFFLSSGYSINKNWSVGVSLAYNFGKTEHYYAIRDTDIQYATTQTETSSLNGINAKFSVNNVRPFYGKKLKLHTSLIYSPSLPIFSRNKTLTSVGILDSYNSDISAFITEDINLEKVGKRTTTIYTPNLFSFGIGIGRDKKWFAGLEGEYQDRYGYSNNYFHINGAKDSYRLALGGFYAPNNASFSGYLKRVVYRGGISFENQNIAILGNDVTNFAISLGASLPLSGFSKFTLGAEYKRRSSLGSSFIIENYFNLKFGVSFGDIWFIKRKYN